MVLIKIKDKDKDKKILSLMQTPGTISSTSVCCISRFRLQLDEILVSQIMAPHLMLSLPPVNKAIDVQHRLQLLEWLWELIIIFKLNKKVYFKCVMYLDKYISISHISLGEYQDVGLLCLLIANKVEGSIALDMLDIVKISNERLSQQDVVRIEMEILLALDFRTYVETPYEVIVDLLHTHIHNHQGEDEDVAITILDHARLLTMDVDYVMKPFIKQTYDLFDKVSLILK